MGQFDEQIARYRELRDQALADLRALEAGRWPGPSPDPKQDGELAERLKHDIDLFNRLIAAYEKNND